MLLGSGRQPESDSNSAAGARYKGVKTMELNNVNKEEEKEKKQKRRSKGQYRVVISNDANESLEGIVNLVNSDFNCGEITKSNVAEWVLINLRGSLPKAEIKKIQENYIDEKKLLQDLLKGSTSDGANLPAEIRKAVKEHFGFSTKHKKVS